MGLSAQESKETTAVLFQTSGLAEYYPFTTLFQLIDVQDDGYTQVSKKNALWHYRKYRIETSLVQSPSTEQRSNVLRPQFCGMRYTVSGLLAPLKGRFKAVVLPKYETHSVLHLLGKFRPTRLTLAKFAIQELIKYEGQADFSCFASLMTGGCHMPYELIAAWKDRHNVPVYNSYGMSE